MGAVQPAGGQMTGSNYFGNQPLGYTSQYGVAPPTQTNALAPTALMMNGTPSPPQAPPAPSSSLQGTGTAPGPAAPASPAQSGGSILGTLGNQIANANSSWAQNYLGSSGNGLVLKQPIPAG